MSTPIVRDEIVVTRVPRPALYDWGILALGIGAVLVGLAVLIYVLWLMVSSVTATPFDADGTRCYKAATSMTCIKTAEPPR